eukprot:Awhi_evm1s15556
MTSQNTQLPVTLLPPHKRPNNERIRLVENNVQIIDPARVVMVYHSNTGPKMLFKRVSYSTRGKAVG